MSRTYPRITNLFLQLGLPADDASIAEFIRTHQLPVDARMTEAPFWSEGQRQFLREQWDADAPWALIVDQLNESLHEDAVKAMNALKSS